MADCRVEPLAHDQVSFLIDDREVCRWHFGNDAPRPFFFPLIGPSGRSVTRMGHPGAPNHDHHRSVWFAHHDVTGVNFWTDSTTAVIRQRNWLCYEDGADARMAVLLDWKDGHDPAPLMTQELIAVVRPDDITKTEGSWFLDLHSRFQPEAEQLELKQTNFGMLAVRVAKRLSAFFGFGQLTGEDGQSGEPNLFNQPNRWVDYSGPQPDSEAPDGTVAEGITLFDHPANSSDAPRWHVREDGWMGPSVCRTEPIVIRRKDPLHLRYRLHIHAGRLDADAARWVHKNFAESPSLSVMPSRTKHTSMEIVETAATAE